MPAVSASFLGGRLANLRRIGPMFSLVYVVLKEHQEIKDGTSPFRDGTPSSFLPKATQKNCLYFLFAGID